MGLEQSGIWEKEKGKIIQQGKIRECRKRGKNSEAELDY